jgi:hypothetical protein
MSGFKFTRYLYAVDEVRAALTISILNKTDDEALFWAYELFHSEYDLIELFWKLYYDFYATLNPAFEKYLLTKFKTGISEPKLVATIVGNFVIRPHNMDIFLLRNLSRPPLVSKVVDLASTDYYTIASAVLNDQVTLDQVLSHYTVQGLKLNKPKIVSDFKKQKVVVAANLLLLTLIMQYESKLKKLKMGKNMYIQVEDSDVEPYATLQLKQPRKILGTVGLRDIGKEKCIGGLFMLTRDTADIAKAYRDDWLYAASFSPLWQSRIRGNNGEIDEQSKQVTFEDDDDFERFYEMYGLEPDEQRVEIQQKSTGAISNETTWYKFYETRSKNAIVKMMSEDVLGKVLY